MAHSSYKSLANIPVKVHNYWHRLSEAYYEGFTLEKRLGLLSTISIITIGIIVYKWFCEPFSGRVDITLLMPLAIVSVVVIFNADLLLTLLLILNDTLISSLASSMISVSALSTLTVPNMLMIVSTAYMVTRTLCFKSANLPLLATPISKSLVFMLLTTVGVGLAYHVKIGGQTPASLTSMLAWFCYFILVLGITSKHRYRAFAITFLVITIFVSLATIAQSYLGISQSIFLKLTSRDTRIEQLDGITRVIPQGYLMFYAMVHFSWHMFLTTESLQKRWGWGLALCLFMTAMVVTMFRNMWFIGGIFMIIQYIMVSTKQKIRAIPYMVAISILLLGSITIATSTSGSLNPFRSITERVSDTRDLNVSDNATSVGSRVEEINKMRTLWINSPIIGIGWGKEFRTQGTWDPFYNTYQITHDLYIHNTLWWFLGKSGIIGLLGLLVFWGVSLGRCWYLAKHTKDDYTRYFITALGVAFASMCVSSMFHPYFSGAPDMIIPISILLGMVELQYFMSQRKATQQSLTTS